MAGQEEMLSNYDSSRAYQLEMLEASLQQNIIVAVKCTPPAVTTVVVS